MSEWADHFCKPKHLTSANAATWFESMADRLLNHTHLMVGHEPHRLTEMEFYYQGTEHPDPFTHCDPLQLECGRWYFHRTRGVYRGGSFKGLDLTFGGEGAYGGILIRGMQKTDGTLIDGPSLCVDHLLDCTGAENVAALDSAIGEREAWEGNPISLREAEGLRSRTIYWTARVGLSLKKSQQSPEPPRYVVRPYRCLTEPRLISKGKLHLVLALHRDGSSAEEIVKITGCPLATVERYVADFEEGCGEESFDGYYGIDLSPKDLCRLHGTWHSRCDA